MVGDGVVIVVMTVVVSSVDVCVSSELVVTSVVLCSWVVVTTVVLGSSTVVEG